MSDAELMAALRVAAAERDDALRAEVAASLALEAASERAGRATAAYSAALRDIQQATNP